MKLHKLALLGPAVPRLTRSERKGLRTRAVFRLVIVLQDIFAICYTQQGSTWAPNGIRTKPVHALVRLAAVYSLS